MRFGILFPPHSDLGARTLNQSRELSTTISEFSLIIGICLGPLIANSLLMMVYPKIYVITSEKLINLLFFELCSISVAGFILHQKGWTLDDFGFEIKLSQCGAGLLLFAIYYLIFVALNRAAASGLDIEYYLTGLPSIAEVSLSVGILFSAVNGFFEEIVVVGYVLKCMHYHGRAFAITLSVLLRFLYHTYQGPIAVVSILPLGFLFAYVYWRWGRLFPLVIAHFLLDVVAICKLGFE